MVEPTLVLMVGGSGSGKSTIRRSLFPDVATVDCDLIKQEHPDYDAKAPSAVHDWSSAEAMRRLMGYLSRGESVVYDSTGTNADKLAMLTNIARSAGMKVRAVLVTCDVETAVKRDAKRERTVGEALVREKHRAVYLTWPVLKTMVDSYDVIPNEEERPQ